MTDRTNHRKTPSAPPAPAPPPRLAPRRAPAPPTNLDFQAPEPELVLLAVTGMSPAVLTETIWALAHPAPATAEPAVLPHRVIVLTTTAGRREIQTALFRPLPRFGNATAWEALRAALAGQGHDLQDRLRFGTTPHDLRVFTTADPASGRTTELEDIRTPADNEAAASFLLEQVRGLVEDPDKRVIASLAGGRKTMGALLYACFSLIGRETDRLTHVLVSEPFDHLRDFFFPAQPGGPLAHRDGSNYQPAAARLELADVPFVPLRHLFRLELGRPAGGFLRLVQSCRTGVRERLAESIRLTVERRRPEIEVNGVRLRLAPREHLLLLFLACRAKNGEPPFAAQKEAERPLKEFWETLRAEAPQEHWSDWRRADSLKSAFDDARADGQDLRRALSSLRGKVLALGGDAAALEACLPQRGRFSLAVPAPLIFLKP